MSAALHLFPRQASARPAYVPPCLAHELAAIDAWCEQAQQRLASLPGVTLLQQRALRRIADELRAELLAQLQAE